MFFLEAKRPGVNISTDRAPAYQIRRYCWNAGLPIGVLTDFEEWAIYDCRAEPSSTDSTTTARIHYFTYEELDERWDDLVALIGRVAVADGSLQKHFADRPMPRGTQTIDQAFLEEIRSWRNYLAKEMARDNRGLSAIQLNEVVQTLIDRIIFLRIAEARGLEAYGELKACADDPSPGVYRRLVGLFRRADDRYNSGLFHFADSRDQHGTPDSLSPSLAVSDHRLRFIIGRLYYPHPYEFSVMPADILGKVYEQFLGEHVVLDQAGLADIVEKPEVRKAGGVYYTPVPIVDYIVEETLGPLLRGKTPGEVAKIRVIDPACGSGSFLIAAYQYIIDWHTAYYAQQVKNRNTYLEKSKGGGLRLKTAERKRILLANIYGVDIDRQAVEVTKLSLLLKVIEGQSQMELAVGRILPDLHENIKCGNSLIDVDFPLTLDASEEERLTYNPFDWDEEFPAVFEAGGFDAVIGNPPYFSIDNVWGRKDRRLAYMKSHYSDIHTDKTDILFYFLQKAASICRGEVGFIVSRSFLEADKAQKLRGWLSTNVRLREVVDFREALVFPGVGINTAIVRYTRSRAAKEATFRRYRNKALPPGYLAGHLREPSLFIRTTKNFAELDSSSWVAADAADAAILKKLDLAGDQVGQVLHVGQGMQTGHNTAFTIPKTDERLLRDAKSARLARKRARNSDIGAYSVADEGPYVLYLEDAPAFARLPDSVQSHLKAHESRLKERAAFQRGDCMWWRYTWPLHKEFVDKPRILVPYRASSNRFSVDARATFVGLTDTTVLYHKGSPEDLHYIAAVLNSRVSTYRFRFLGKLVGGGTYEYFHNTVGKLPVPRRLPGDPTHDRLVELSKVLHEENETIRSTILPDEQEASSKLIADAAAEVETLVAQLFGLTEVERQRIEEYLAQ
ncbi:Type IIS restriction enzyme Eco57I [Nocardioides dokdonensis FR1436]|uniref:site-specific DNA-methyltransferase (adenine-specific) n=2 Tax=Nocardioides TaxID=1839 RepID=A0A1A9GPF5_9ACTN|nr:Type IIS restriction enzyme Eco57I [Nocardioides dokdonensis FR1436]